MKRFLTLFAGGGGADLGIRMAGHQTLVAFERDERISETFKLNFPETVVICDDCTKADYSWLANLNINAIWASPPCQDASIARSKDLAPHKDKDAGYCIINAVEAIAPDWVYIENVPQYRNTEVYKEILHFLWSKGYWINESVVNAADFGVPQNRKRMILRACKTETPSPLPPKQVHQGWYAAIADLIPSCPVTELADWQKKLILEKGYDLPLLVGKSGKPPTTKVTRGNNDYKVLIPAGGRGLPVKEIKPSPTITCSGSPKVLIPHAGARKSSFRLIKETEPAPTLRALGHSCHSRQFDLFDGTEVRKLTPQCEARLQTFPDDYNFGDLPNWLKKRIIGNAVPCLLAKEMVE